jgi:hypothetical protein
MQLGTLIPQRDIGGSPGELREFSQAAEAFGYNFFGSHRLCTRRKS